MARSQRRKASRSGRNRRGSGSGGGNDETNGGGVAAAAAPPPSPPLPTKSSAGSGPRPQPHRNRNPFGFFKRFEPRFMADIVSELRKVTWPSFAETRYLTIVVGVVAIAMGILLGSADLFFGWIIEQLFFN